MNRPLRPRTTRAPVSLAQVAARAGVSIATVSRIVNGVSNRASGATVARVKQAVDELGYRPLNVGRALRSGESRIVALLAANLANPTMSAIAASTETALREAGYVMILCDTHDRPDIQDEYLLELRAHLTSAMVLLGAVESPGLARFVAAGEPLVFVNRRYPGPEALPFVGIDNRAAGRDVAEFLLARGVTRPAMIHGPISSSATADRVAGFTARLAAAGLKPATATAGGLDHLAIGHRGMATLLENGAPPDALFCASDLIAYGAGRRLAEAGLTPGRDCLVVGFDDNPLNDWVAPWLNSVQVPYAAYGQAIVDVLDAADPDAEPAVMHLPHRLVLRG